MSAKPSGPHAQATLADAISKIIADGGNPYTTPYVVDLDFSEQFRPKQHVAHRVPCLTFSRKAGLWITDRGRRMTPTECMRIQGISSRAVAGLPASFIRSCVGNAMSVRVASMLVDAAFKVMAPFEQSPRVVAAPASVETSRIRGVSTPVTTVHRRPFLPQKAEKFKGILYC